jgi:hypothetical protein
MKKVALFGLLSCLFPTLGVFAMTPVSIEKVPKDYYVSVSNVRTSISGTGNSDLKNDHITSTELKFGYFIRPDMSIEGRYDNGGKMGSTSSLLIERKKGYAMFIRGTADFASGFKDTVRLKGYLVGGVGRNTQSISTSVTYDQTVTTFEYGAGLLLELGDTLYLDAGYTSRGSFDKTLLTSGGTSHYSFDLGIGAKF